MFPIIRSIVFVALFMGFVLLYVPLRWIAGQDAVNPAGVGLLGLAPFALGLALVLWCCWEFATRGRGTPAVFDPPRKLVTRGPYRYVRNPMYIGSWLMLLGLSVLTQSPGVLLYAATFTAGTMLFVVVYEEWTLASRFGPDYAAYKQSVPRWIPRFR